MNDMYEVLETCLQEIENGADVDTVLFRHPEFAEELRPILGASVQAKRLAAADPSPDVLRRGRAKVLQRAAQMREAQVRPSRRFWSVPLRRALASLAVIAVLFMGSTGLVQASSSTLPGDNLYPVKRTWEDVRVLLTFDTQAREALEIEQENERIEELNEMIAEGRSGKVDFAGIVTSQNGDLWLVSKIPVLISAQTDVRAPSVKIGDAVRVRGLTWSDGTVHAERVELLPAGIPLPSVGDEPEFEQETPEIKEAGEDNSGPGSGDESPEAEETKAPEEGSKPEGSTLNGVVDSMSGNVLIVNGQPMNISGAEIKGTPKTGAAVKVEGFFDENGMFVVTKIEFQDNGSSDGSGSEDATSNDNGNDGHSGDGQNDNSNDNGGEDNSNNHTSEDNSNDNSGSSGGSGGGDD